MLKANLTKGSDPEVKEIISQYDIKGVPTVIFIGSDGQERPALRINQFEKADLVLANFDALFAQGAESAKAKSTALNE
jgi:thiol:disulfide interchange protein DsbD